MKLKFYLITIVLLFVAFSVKAEGDKVISVYTNNSQTSTKIAISEVSKIVFDTESLNIVTNAGDNHFNYADVAKITFNEALGLDAITATNNNVTISPNPTRDNLTISCSEDMFGSDLYIYTLTGALVTKQTNWNGESINVSDLNAGVYLININSTTLKFIKQ